MLLDDTLEAFTDGSSLPSPRRGGIGVRFVWIDEDFGEEVIEDLSPPGYKGGTNQEMEILACTVAFEEAVSLDIPPSTRRLVILTDSTYVQENYTSALFQWPKQKYFGSSGAPIENAVDWKEFKKAYSKARERFEVIRIEWVKGKSNRHTKAVDRLAKNSAENAFNPTRKVANVRRKQSPELVERGSVPMEGQVMTMRIRASQILEVQKLWRCHYEVLSEDSPYYGKASVIITDMERRMDAGHTYVVRVNDNDDDPRIEEIISEVLPDDDLTHPDEFESDED